MGKMKEMAMRRKSSPEWAGIAEALSGGWMDNLPKAKTKSVPLEVALRNRTKNPLTGDRCHKRTPYDKTGGLLSRAAKMLA